MAIKAIVLDIDGTLTNDAKVVTPLTREALMRAQEAGVRVILASGRPVQGLRALAHELDLDRYHGMLVAFNGAHVVDAETDEVLYEQPMAVEDMHDLIAHLRNFDVITWVTDGPYLYVEDAFRCDITFKGAPFNIVKYERDACDLMIREVRDLTEVCEKPQDKILTAATGFRACSPPSSTSNSWRGTSPRPMRSPGRCPSSGSMRPRSSPSVTVRTTPRCSRGRARAWPWATPSTRSRPSPIA